MKKICFITTSRADFSTLNELIKETTKKNFFKIQLIISGSHNNKIFGTTNKEIKSNKKYQIKKIKLNLKNKDSKSVAFSFSQCVNKFSKALEDHTPPPANTTGLFDSFIFFKSVFNFEFIFLLFSLRMKLLDLFFSMYSSP